MNRVLVFDLRAKTAHFRLPDTTVTHPSYPFIPRTALQGLLASILGLEQLDSPDQCEPNLIGIRLMAPVASSFQQISMLGKGWGGSKGDTFNRPVTVQVLVNPYYRAYYSGPHVDSLAEMIASGRSVFHTYLGSCWCPVFPRYVDTLQAREIVPKDSEILLSSVVPTCVVKEIIPEAGKEYARAGGMHYRYLGRREFEGTVNLLYEVGGNPIRVRCCAPPAHMPVRFVVIEKEEIICLW